MSARRSESLGDQSDAGRSDEAPLVVNKLLPERPVPSLAEPRTPRPPARQAPRAESSRHAEALGPHHRAEASPLDVFPAEALSDDRKRSLIGAGLGAQREAFESALKQAAQQAQALGERLSVLMASQQGLSETEDRIEEIEQRIGHALADLGAQVADLDARRETIDAELTAAVRSTDALDQRVATLTAPEHALRQAALRFEDLEQRSTQALGDLAARATELDAKSQAIELVLADAAQQTQALDDRLTSFTLPDGAVRQAEACIEEVEQRAANAVTVLSTRVTELAVQRDAIDTALAEAARTATTLQARVAVLTAPDHALRQAQSQVEDLETHAAAALADLGNRATELTAQRQTIEVVLAEAERAQTMLADVVARLAALTNEGELRCVEATVADLEGRTSDAAAQLQRVVTKKDALEHALVDAQRQLQGLDEAAQRDLARLATASKRAARAANGSVLFWRIAAVSAVAALVVLGIVAMRARTESASPLATIQPLLTDTPRSSPAATATTEPTRQTAQNVPSSQLAVANAPAAPPRQPAKAAIEVARPSQVARVVATPVTRKPVATPSPQAASAASTRTDATTKEGATGATVQFVGDLEVSSEPSGATVYIDTTPVGETPLSIERIRAGSRVLWVVRDGYARWTRGVLVPANKLTRVSATLEPIP